MLHNLTLITLHQKDGLFQIKNQKEMNIRVAEKDEIFMSGGIGYTSIDEDRIGEYKKINIREYWETLWTKKKILHGQKK